MPICNGCVPRFARNARRQYGLPAPLLSVPGPDKAGVLYWDSGDTAAGIQASIGAANSGAGPTMNAGWRGPTVKLPASDAAASTSTASPLSVALARFQGVVSPTAAAADLPSKNPVARLGENRALFGKGECEVARPAPSLPVVTSDMKRFAVFSLIGLLVGSVLRDANGGTRV